MTKADKICSAGVVYFYTAGIADKSEVVNLETVDSSRYLPEGFYERASALSEVVEEYPDAIQLFGVIGPKDKTNKISEIVRLTIKNNFERIIAGKNAVKNHPRLDEYGNAFFKLTQEYFCEDPIHYPLEKRLETDTWNMYCLYIYNDEMPDNLIESVLDIWLNAERPEMLGKQLAIRSFLFRELIGKKVVGNVANYEESTWNIIFEGGTKLPIGENAIFISEKAGFELLHHHVTSSQVDSILNNPGLAYGKYFLPTAICVQWYKAFIFACAVSENAWDSVTLSAAIERLVIFLENNICETFPDKQYVSKETFTDCALRAINDMRAILRGEETEIISKDYLKLLQNRYTYLPYLYELIGYQPKNTAENNTFLRKELIELIERSNARNANEKGTTWEAATEYVINNIFGLKISGKRIKTKYQEIDISVVNTSLSDEIWQLGAYIMVECKNWSRKVDIPVIRNLAYTSMMKGNSTVLLFTANGLTGDAQTEIERLAGEDIFILEITKEDLYSLCSADDCFELIMNKFRHLAEVRDETFNL